MELSELRKLIVSVHEDFGVGYIPRDPATDRPKGPFVMVFSFDVLCKPGERKARGCTSDRQGFILHSPQDYGAASSLKSCFRYFPQSRYNSPSIPHIELALGTREPLDLFDRFMQFWFIPETATRIGLNLQAYGGERDRPYRVRWVEQFFENALQTRWLDAACLPRFLQCLHMPRTIGGGDEKVTLNDLQGLDDLEDLGVVIRRTQGSELVVHRPDLVLPQGATPAVVMTRGKHIPLLPIFADEESYKDALAVIDDALENPGYAPFACNQYSIDEAEKRLESLWRMYVTGRRPAWPKSLRGASWRGFIAPVYVRLYQVVPAGSERAGLREAMASVIAYRVSNKSMQAFVPAEFKGEIAEDYLDPTQFPDLWG